MNDIHQKTKIEKNKLSVYLKNLIELGILLREFPVTDSVKVQSNISRGLYKVTDNFFRFWYAFVFPNQSELEAGDAEGIWHYVVRPELDRYTSYLFEEVCRQYLRKQNRKNALPFRFTQIGRWWDKTGELDIMATDLRRTNFLIGECKYKNSAFDISDLNKTLGKFTPKDKDSRIYYWLFSKSGFTDQVKRVAEELGINLVTVEQLIE
jgi:AAA+ ATPase superfamily predicted ATPase